MKDEIKEIDALLFYLIHTDRLKQEEKQYIADYITNLQQENKEWAMIFDTFSKRPYAHKYLEEKRKELGNDKIIGLDSEMIYKDYYDYKSRVEKAIEICEPLVEWGECTINGKILKRIYNILQNGSEE